MRTQPRCTFHGSDSLRPIPEPNRPCLRGVYRRRADGAWRHARGAGDLDFGARPRNWIVRLSRANGQPFAHVGLHGVTVTEAHRQARRFKDAGGYELLSIEELPIDTMLSGALSVGMAQIPECDPVPSVVSATHPPALAARGVDIATSPAADRGGLGGLLVPLRGRIPGLPGRAIRWYAHRCGLNQ